MKRFGLILSTLMLAVLPLQAQWVSCPQECCQPCWGVEVYGEYLYWKVSEDQLQYAATMDLNSTNVSAIVDPTSLLGIISVSFSEDSEFFIEGQDLKDPDFQYNSGFRVGLGFNFGRCSNWHANVEYTRLHNTTHSSVSDSVNGVFPIGYPLLPSLVVLAAFDRTGTSILGDIFSVPLVVTNEFQFRYDTIDLQFGLLKQCSCFCARPYFGGKGAWIRQRSDTAYFALGFDTITLAADDALALDPPEFPITASLNKRNDFRAGGLEIGVDSALQFWGNLALTGGFQAALLYGHFSVESTPSFVPTGTTLPALVGKVTGFHENRIRPMVNAYIGLDWDTCFCNRYIFSVGAAWELQYWWNQWQAPSSVDATIFKGGDAPQGDLSLQGLTVFASITF